MSRRCLSELRIFRQISTNHYKSLGLPVSASQSEVKKAYYKLSKIHHPDRNNGSEESAQKFREITNAYKVLSNVNSRRFYDVTLNNRKFPTRMPRTVFRPERHKYPRNGKSRVRIFYPRNNPCNSPRPYNFKNSKSNFYSEQPPNDTAISVFSFAFGVFYLWWISQLG